MPMCATRRLLIGPPCEGARFSASGKRDVLLVREMVSAAASGTSRKCVCAESIRPSDERLRGLRARASRRSSRPRARISIGSGALPAGFFRGRAAMLARILPDGEPSPPMRRLVVFASVLGLVLACAWLAEPPAPTASLEWHDCGGDFACAERARARRPRARAAARARAARGAPARGEARPAPRRAVRESRRPGRLGGRATCARAGRAWASSCTRASTWSRSTRAARAPARRSTATSHSRDSWRRTRRRPDDAKSGRARSTRAARSPDECARKHGALLPFMSSADNARDLDWVRAALGEERISYLGYLVRDRARRELRDPVSRARARARARRRDRSRRSISRSSRASRPTRSRRALVAYDAEAKRKGWHGTETLDDVVRARAAQEHGAVRRRPKGLASPPDGWRELASALGRAQVGRLERASTTLAQRYFGERSDGTRELSVEAQLATLCADQHRMASVDAYREALPGLAAVSRTSAPRTCSRTCPAPSGPSRRAARCASPARDAAPILVIANSDDPLTPHLWGERLAARFP